MGVQATKFNAAISQRIESQTVAREGKAVTRNELIESFFELVPKRSDSWNPTHHFLSDNVNAVKPENIANYLMAVSAEERGEFVKTLDSIVRGKQATPEAKAFAQTVLQNVVGPEYNGWKPTR